MFASDLDAASRQQLTRGARLMELLKQPEYSPYPMEDQVVSIWSGIKGKLDKIPVADVLRFERELLDHLRRNTKVLADIASSGQLTDDNEAALEIAVDDFVATFLSTEGTELSTTSSTDDGEGVNVAQEQIVTKKR
jgi:F-type H+-transporting ATPase subunit alpha